MPSERDLPSDPSAKLVRNERDKLTATYINGVAIALFAVGGLAPMISAVAQASGQHADPRLLLALFVTGAIGSGILHFAARMMLRDLKA